MNGCAVALLTALGGVFVALAILALVTWIISTV